MHKILVDEIKKSNKSYLEQIKTIKELTLEVEYKIKKQEEFLLSIIREYSVLLGYKERKSKRKYIKYHTNLLKDFYLKHTKLLNEIIIYENLYKDFNEKLEK